MLFKTVAVLTMAATAIARPHASHHHHHSQPSASGNAAWPSRDKWGTGNSTGVYGTGNNTAIHGPTGTGFAAGTGSIPGVVGGTGVVISPGNGHPAVSPAAGSLCHHNGQFTSTAYSVKLYTVTATVSPAAATVLSSSSHSYGGASASSVAPDYYNSSAVSPHSPAVESPEGNIEPILEEPPTINPAGAFYEVPPGASPSPPSVVQPPPVPILIPTSSVIAAPPPSTPTTTSAAPPSYTSLGSTGPHSTGKRGLAYNSAASTNAFVDKSMSWAYNWQADPSGTLVSAAEYVPMLWGAKQFGGWDAAAKAALASGSTSLLSFNEPDLDAQASMDSATAAAAHIKYMNPFAGQAKIGSPAITNGGPTGGTDGMGLGWMKNFFDKCGGQCKVDFIAFHWYDSAGNVAYFKNYVQSVIDFAAQHGVSKVWLTEFGASGSNDEVARFLGEVLPWMDAEPAIERYAYFMCSDGILINGNGVSSPVGVAYAA